MLPTTLTYITLLMIQICSLKQVPKRHQQKDIKQISLKLVSAIFYQFFYKLVTRVSQYFCFLNRPMKGGDILDF